MRPESAVQCVRWVRRAVATASVRKWRYMGRHRSECDHRGAKTYHFAGGIHGGILVELPAGIGGWFRRLFVSAGMPLEWCALSLLACEGASFKTL